MDAGPYTFVAADALALLVREGGRVVKVSALVATGVNAEGYREILGIQVATGESTASWLGFFRDLVARRLTAAGPVGLVTSDAHAGLVEAIGDPDACARHLRGPVDPVVADGRRARPHPRVPEPQCGYC